MTKEQQLERNKQAAIEEKLEELALWYVANAPVAKDPPVICVATKPYRNIRMWWLEPLIPLIENPVLIQEQLGDSWTLRLEPISRKIA